MKSFDFKFERLLKIREHKEIIAKQEYAKVLQKKINLQNEINELDNEVEIYNKQLFDEIKIGDKIDGFFFIETDNFRRGSALKKMLNFNEIENMQDTLTEKKSGLDNAVKEKKMLEKLKEREYKKYKKESEKYLMSKADDTAGITYNKKLNKSEQDG